MSERSEKIDLSDLELALRELRPRPETLNRAVFMYRAGRASARGWAWPLATLVSTAATFALSIALWLRPAPSIVYVSVPSSSHEAISTVPVGSAQSEDTQRGAWMRYVHLQEQMSLKGLDALPPSPDSEEQPPSVESLQYWESPH